MNTRLVFVVLGFAIITIGCTHTIKHPPTFQDYVYVYRTKDPLWGDVLKLGESLKFTHDELQLIKETKSSNLLVGAGIQSARYDKSGLELLRQATNLSPSSPVTMAALAYHEIGIFLYENDSLVKYESIVNDIKEFEEIDPENSIPVLLRSYLFFKNNEVDKAIELIKSTKSKSKTETYEIDIRKTLIEAAEYIGYPSYTSHAYAIGFEASVFLMVVLVKDILEVVPEDKVLLETFLELGKKLEQQAKLNIEIMSALVIQSRCLSALGYGENDVQIRKLMQKKTDLKKYIPKTSTISLNQIQEARWIQFYEESFELGEKKAIENLYSEYK